MNSHNFVRINVRMNRTPKQSMAKRLIKVAKEFNLGTKTIVDFLKTKEISIENKPTTQLSDDMYGLLLDEFSKSREVRGKADEIIRKNQATKEKKETKVPKFSLKTPLPPPPGKKVAPIAPPPKQQEEEPVQENKTPQPKEEVVENKAPEVVETTPPPTQESKEEEKKEEENTTQLGGLKIKGKINLDEVSGKKKSTKKKKEKEAPAKSPEPKKPEVEAEKPEPPKKEEKPEVAAPKTDKKPVEDKPVPDQETPQADPLAENPPAEKKTDELTRGKTPQLEGLKIKGKINLEKFSRPKKKKEEPANKGKDGAKDGKKTSDDSRPKRKRKRKKVVKQSIGGRRRSDAPVNRKRSDKDEVKEISQKEIEERIKATKAAIQGGRKNQRQRIRRDSRQKKREERERKEEEQRDERLQVTEFISVQELANMMDISPSEIIMTCMNLGQVVTINQRLDAELIEVVASEFNHEVVFVDSDEELEEEDEIIDNPEDLKPRAPIVTVMGHVDHGKTSLLDYVRKANVADGEAGGITQHIGAYEVALGEGDDRKKITFLDTPGHEAFTAMRARGAKVTDVAIIIIAADDQIMPQTKEAISHAQAAEVPMVFAINKIDKPGAQPERIKQQLAEMNILVEEWGGSFQSHDISAKKGLGIEDLLEKVLLEAEVLELKANPDRRASGAVLEASLDKGRGYVTKMLVQTGTLKVGDPIVAGEHQGKVKAMFNERGKRIKVAGPSTPILVLGLGGAPQAGEKFKATETESESKAIANRRAQIAREQSNRAAKRVSLAELGRRLALGTFKELNLIIKGDVDGSIEALADSLLKLSQETVQVNVIHKAVGQIIESDVLLASASDAIIVGFQVRPSGNARKLAEKEGVEIKTYSIIYEVIDEVKSAIEGMLEPTKEEKVICEVEVREVFKINRVGTIAGCYVKDGTIKRNSKIRVIRDGIVKYPVKEGQIAELGSLKRFKDDAKEVRKDMECGLTVKNFNDIKIGDIIEGYEIIEVKQTLA